jgi:hypothetical protein
MRMPGESWQIFFLVSSVSHCFLHFSCVKCFPLFPTFFLCQVFPIVSYIFPVSSVSHCFLHFSCVKCFPLFPTFFLCQVFPIVFYIFPVSSSGSETADNILPCVRRKPSAIRWKPWWWREPGRESTRQQRWTVSSFSPLPPPTSFYLFSSLSPPIFSLPYPL